MTVTASPDRKVYDGTVQSNALPGVVGLVGGDTASFTEEYVNKDAGPEILVPTGNASSNYDVTLHNAAGRITPASLVVSVGSGSTTYGQLIPEFSCIVIGAINGDVTATSTTAAGQFSDPGAYPVTAQLSGDLNNYAIVVNDGILIIQKANQTIIWPTPSGISLGTPLSTAQLNATAVGVPGGSAPGGLSYDPAAGTILDAGSQPLTVSAAATVDYDAATAQVILDVTASPKPLPKITWNMPASITFGTPLDGGLLNATASVPGTFAYTAVRGTILPMGIQTLSVTFTPDDPNYGTATTDVYVDVTSDSVSPGSSSSVPGTAEADQYIPPSYQQYFYGVLEASLRADASSVTTGLDANGIATPVWVRPAQHWFSPSDPSFVQGSSDATVLQAVQLAPNVFFHDSIGNGIYEPGDTVWVDTTGQDTSPSTPDLWMDTTGQDIAPMNPNIHTYHAGDQLISGTAPTTSGVFRGQPMYYIDYNHDGRFEPGEELKLDINQIESTSYKAGVVVPYAFYDVSGTGKWTPADPIWSDPNNSGTYSTDDTIIYAGDGTYTLSASDAGKTAPTGALARATQPGPTWRP